MLFNDLLTPHLFNPSFQKATHDVQITLRGCHKETTKKQTVQIVHFYRDTAKTKADKRKAEIQRTRANSQISDIFLCLS